MASANRERVLVADDNAEWRYIIARMLRAEYDIVGYVERGDELIATASSLHPDVVTLDLSMPGQSGISVLAGLRHALPDAILVVISSTEMQVYIDEAFACGADAYVKKNRVITDLLPAISAGRRSALGRRHSV